MAIEEAEWSVIRTLKDHCSLDVCFGNLDATSEWA